MKLLFVGKAPNFIDLVGSFGWEDPVQAYRIREWVDLKDIPRTTSANYAYVAPCDSFGMMNNGVNTILSRVLFPGIDRSVKDSFSKVGVLTSNGIPYCPIGKAVTVPTFIPYVQLIATPIYWVYQNVKHTHNAYHAMYAILEEAYQEKNRIDIMVIPIFCTEEGISSIESMRQMKMAYDDFQRSIPPRWNYVKIIKEQPILNINNGFRIHGVSNEYEYESSEVRVIDNTGATPGAGIPIHPL